MNSNRANTPIASRPSAVCGEIYNEAISAGCPISPWDGHSRPKDCQAVAYAQLTELVEKMEKAKAIEGLDTYTKAHLQNVDRPSSEGVGCLAHTEGSLAGGIILSPIPEVG